MPEESMGSYISWYFKWGSQPTRKQLKFPAQKNYIKCIKHSCRIVRTTFLGTRTGTFCKLGGRPPTRIWKWASCLLAIWKARYEKQERSWDAVLPPLRGNYIKYCDEISEYVKHLVLVCRMSHFQQCNLLRTVYTPYRFSRYQPEFRWVEGISTTIH